MQLCFVKLTMLLVILNIQLFPLIDWMVPLLGERCNYPSFLLLPGKVCHCHTTLSV